MGKENDSITTTSAPWGDTQNYLSGTSNVPGVLPESARLYSENLWSPEQQTLLQSQQDYLAQNTPERAAAMEALQAQLSGGQYDPAYAAAGVSNIPQAMSSMGALDPTASLQRLSTGQVDNPQLANMNQANINASMQGFGDMMDQVNQTFMPQIGRDAQSAGQYGGSRQGIAEGLLGQQVANVARDLTQSNVDAGNQLYGTAYENAQNRMQQTAGNLGDQGLQNSQFNVNTDLNRNTQNAANMGTQLANQLAGLDLGNAASSAMNSGYSTGQQLLGTPGAYDWSNLAKYMDPTIGTAQATSNMGSVTKTEDPGTLSQISTYGQLGSDLYGLGGDIFGW